MKLTFIQANVEIACQ